MEVKAIEYYGNMAIINSFNAVRRCKAGKGKGNHIQSISPIKCYDDISTVQQSTVHLALPAW